MPEGLHSACRLISATGHFIEFFLSDGPSTISHKSSAKTSASSQSFRAIAGQVSFEIQSDTPSLIHAQWTKVADVIQKGGTPVIFHKISNRTEIFILQHGELLELDRQVKTGNGPRTIWQRQILDTTQQQSKISKGKERRSPKCVVAKLEEQKRGSAQDPQYFGLNVRVGDHSHGILVNLKTKAIRIEKWSRKTNQQPGSSSSGNDAQWTKDPRSFVSGEIPLLPGDLVCQERNTGEKHETESGVWEILESCGGTGEDLECDLRAVNGTGIDAVGEDNDDGCPHSGIEEDIE